MYFNSHPHEEDDGNSYRYHIHRIISTHILTKRMTLLFSIHSYTSLFQLTSSRRGWQEQKVGRTVASDFNSHPHEEDDGNNVHADQLRSRFQLTSSRRGWPLPYTFITELYNFNSHPHEEDDRIVSYRKGIYNKFQLTSSRRGWRYPLHNTNSYVLFQLTSSRRGWRFYLNCKSRAYTISTHILTKRMTLLHSVQYKF